MTPRRRAALVLGTAGVALVLLTALPLPAPDGLRWAALERWHTAVGPAVVAMALARVAAQLAAAWLVLVSGLQLAAARSHQPGLAALADRLAPRFLRSVASGAASLSLGVGLIAPAMPAVASGPPPGTAVMVPLDAPTTRIETTTTITTSAPPSTTTTTTPATTTTTTPATTTTTTPAPPTSPPSVTPTSPPPPRDARTVRPGDSFWSIAEAVAGDAHVDDYWPILIDANRDRLVDPGNPDLLYPGQVLRLPTP